MFVCVRVITFIDTKFTNNNNQTRVLRMYDICLLYVCMYLEEREKLQVQSDVARRKLAEENNRLKNRNIVLEEVGLSP